MDNLTPPVPADSGLSDAQKIVPILASFQANSEGLEKTDKELSQLLGNDWRLVIRQKISIDDHDTMAKLDNLIAYDTAVSAWNLGSKLAVSGTIEEIKSKIFDVCYWLAFFGAAGNDLAAKLAAKIGMPLDQLQNGVASHKPVKEKAAEPNKTAATATTTTTTTVESKADAAKPQETKPWLYENFKRLLAYYDATVSRTSARCVRLGGISMNEYPYYDYVLDVMKEIIDTAKELEKTPDIQKIIADDFHGGVAGFSKLVDGLKTDLMTNAPPEMVESEVDLDKVKSSLGNMVDDVSEGRIGPAEDGFLTTEDLISAQPQTGTTAPNPSPLEKGL